MLLRCKLLDLIGLGVGGRPWYWKCANSARIGSAINVPFFERTNLVVASESFDGYRGVNILWGVLWSMQLRKDSLLIES